jgi:hypothetical protein
LLLDARDLTFKTVVQLLAHSLLVVEMGYVNGLAALRTQSVVIAECCSLGSNVSGLSDPTDAAM